MMPVYDSVRYTDVQTLIHKLELGKSEVQMESVLKLSSVRVLI